MTKPCLLLVSKTSSLADLCRGWQHQTELPVIEAHDGHSGFELIQAEHPAVAVLALPTLDTDLLRRCLHVSPDTRFIIIDTSCSAQSVVKAMRAGAYDVLSTPLSKPQLFDAIMGAFSETTSKVKICSQVTPRTILGSSQIMTDTRARILAVSGSSGNVFISGESGTGKELCAQAIHKANAPGERPFVTLKCSGMPKSQLCYELFGSPGDVGDGGAFHRARGGTLFLDDVCDLGLETQSKLLHFLETAMSSEKDGKSSRDLKVRLICATNRNPPDELAAKRFRPDLFYRLFVLPINMPPLRQREQDILELAEAYLLEISEEEKRRFTRLSVDAQDALLAYSWPGNIRQLINVLRHAIVLNDARVLEASMLPSEIAAAPGGDTEDWPSALPIEDLVGRPMNEVERQVIEANISAQQGSVTKAAEILGLSPSTIYRKRESWQ